MTKGRIEAFSDGVFAIIITIMVLELKVPHEDGLAELLALWPVLLSYILSFVKIGTYWIIHHALFQRVAHVGGWVLWANLHLLFWLSLMPFATGLIGEHDFAALPVALYSFDLLMCALAFALLVRALRSEHDGSSDFAQGLGTETRGRLSILSYLSALGLAWFLPHLALVPIIAVAVIWIAPDRRARRGAQNSP